MVPWLLVMHFYESHTEEWMVNNDQYYNERNRKIPTFLIFLPTQTAHNEYLSPGACEWERPSACFLLVSPCARVGKGAGFIWQVEERMRTESDVSFIRILV